MELVKEKRRTFLYRLFYRKGSLLRLIFISQCIVYWIHFQNIHPVTYQETLLHILFKIVKTFSVSLSKNNVTVSFISKWKPKAKSLFSNFFSHKILMNRLNQGSYWHRTSFNIMFWGMSLNRLRNLLEKLNNNFTNFTLAMSMITKQY